MSQPQGGTQTVGSGVMEPCYKTRAAWIIQDQHLSDGRLMTQVKRFIDESLNRGSTVGIRNDVQFEVFILAPHPRMPIDTRRAGWEEIHGAFRAFVKAIDVRRVAELKDQSEVLW
jgi:hypothetical protein